ncbi:hypothetical protein FGO68_gene10800 [Halteria grandinella]|uniref:Non-specific serine/threonine protein kinase n=1 Tax=Halteria grandinella TaxID=5974 RepID=A0A8J8T1Y1_HALGN|nr:hypothetical protein FGO68_gene10800 [Halteria grandinella]
MRVLAYLKNIIMGQCASCLDTTNQGDSGRGPKRKKGRKNSIMGGINVSHSPAHNSNRRSKKVKRIGKDDFKIHKVIGKGSYGKVYLVERLEDEAILASTVHQIDLSHLSSMSGLQTIQQANLPQLKQPSGKFFAMKCMKKSTLYQTDQVDTVRSERDILAQMDHPFTVKLYYAFQTATKLYLIMEFVNGGELFYHLKREQRFSEDRVRFYAAECVLAIEHLHGLGIIYRDLKPENILLDSEGHIKITDFGLSKTGQIKEGSETYSFCGTPEYLAPEIIAGTGHTKSVDWWSLGLLIFEMVCGFHPFKIKNKSHYEKFKIIQDTSQEVQIPHYVSPQMKSLLQGLLQKDSINRLTVDKIKTHEFFSSITDWDVVQRRELTPPYIPTVSSDTDISNIDRYFTRELPEETPEESLKLKALGKEREIKDAKFEGFSFNNEKEQDKLRQTTDTRTQIGIDLSYQ